MIATFNIEAYIYFLFQKRSEGPAPIQLKAKWAGLSELELKAALKGLYQH